MLSTIVRHWQDWVNIRRVPSIDFDPVDSGVERHWLSSFVSSTSHDDSETKPELEIQSDWCERLVLLAWRYPDSVSCWMIVPIRSIVLVWNVSDDVSVWRWIVVTMTFGVTSLLMMRDEHHRGKMRLKLSSSLSGKNDYYQYRWMTKDEKLDELIKNSEWSDSQRREAKRMNSHVSIIDSDCLTLLVLLVVQWKIDPFMTEIEHIRVKLILLFSSQLSAK